MKAGNVLHKLSMCYYLATPLFYVVDQFAGLSIRITGLDGHPILKQGYYAGCLGIGALTCLFPKATHPLTLAESVANIIVLILGVMLPILQAPDAIMSGKEVLVAGPRQIVNFVISGGFALLAFYANPLMLAGRIKDGWEE